ncbi:MAG TPA: translation elongation factor Ts [Abditibacteriaceae bacterium]|jgi:elongation factor Ts
MATIDAAAVKKLREMTNAGIMDCKGALTDAGGDFDEAVKILREKGIASAGKKADRVAADGTVGVFVAEDGKRAALVEVNCETDFVARNEKFQELASQLAQQVAQSQSADVQALLTEPFAGDSGKTVEEHVKESISTIGENIVIGRLAAFQTDNGVIASYVHTDGKQAALVEVDGEVSDTARELARNVAMQAVAMKAPYLHRDHVPADVIEGEKHIYRQQAAGEGKPEAMLDKIAEGRLNKFYGQNTLLEQESIHDSKKTVQQLLKDAGNVQVTRFVRYKVGEA